MCCVLVFVGQIIQDCFSVPVCLCQQSADKFDLIIFSYGVIHFPMTRPHGLNKHQHQPQLKKLKQPFQDKTIQKPAHRL